MNQPMDACPVRVLPRPRDQRLELTFDGRFTYQDVEAVRSIEGRRWVRDRGVWVLPDHPEALDALERSFGSRLRVEPRQGDAPPTEAQPGGARPGDDAHGEPRSSDSLAGGSRAGEAPPSPEQVIQALRRVFRTREYSPRTERAYVNWTRRFLSFHGSAFPGQPLDRSHAIAYLEHLATRRRLAAKSRNVAASAMAFMFREILGRDEMDDVARARGPKRVPTVLSHREVLLVLGELTGKYKVAGALLYSAGLRLEECLNLRVKDVDFELRQILVRDGKGRKDRYVPLADRATDLVRAQIRQVTQIHDADRADGHGWARLPGAFHRKDPMAGYEPRWQFLFPATTINADPATGQTGRWHLHATAVQRVMKEAVRKSGISKPATCHTLRHSFATETLRSGCDIRTLQHLMGHKDIRTTMIYLHIVEQTGHHVRSPLDRPDDADTGGLPWGGMAHQWEVAGREAERRRGGGGRGRHGERG